MDQLTRTPTERVPDQQGKEKGSRDDKELESDLEVVTVASREDFDGDRILHRSSSFALFARRPHRSDQRTVDCAPSSQGLSTQVVAQVWYSGVYIHWPIRRSVPTYRKFRFLPSPEGLIAFGAIPQKETLSMGPLQVGEVLGYPKQHDERASHSVKTWNNRTTLHDPPLANKSRVIATLPTPKTAVWLFICSARGYIR